MRKLALARVSYRNDFLISYHVYMMTGSFHISKVPFMLVKYTSDSKSQTLRMCYPLQSTDKPISYQNKWSFCVYMILLRDFIPEWILAPVTYTGVTRASMTFCGGIM